MKRFNWPAEGLPGGNDTAAIGGPLTDYPFNPIRHGETRVSQYVTDSSRWRRRRPVRRTASSTADRPGFGPLPVRGLRVLPPLARHGRQGLGRSQLQAHASRTASLQRRSCRKSARPGPLVRLARSDGQKVLQHGAAVRKLGLIGHLENTYPRFIGSDFNAGEKFVGRACSLTARLQELRANLLLLPPIADRTRAGVGR